MVELQELGVELGMHVSGALFASFLLRPILVDQILEAQLEDPYLMSMRRKVEEGEQSDFLAWFWGCCGLSSCLECYRYCIYGSQLSKLGFNAV